MIDITFEFSTGGQPTDSDPFLDDYEIRLLFESTRQQMRQQITRALNHLRCETHGQAPRVKVSGVYNRTNEQFDLQYHIDGCCNLLVMQAIHALNN